jgi:O-antigen/teichoic acid export membrane protein
MSTTSRLISGSAASWAQIAVTLVSQVALVPLYLSHWSVATYGVWLAIQALISLISLLDFGHQEYLAYEFLRLNRTAPSSISKYLWSGVSIGLLLSLLQIVLIVGFLATGVLPSLLGKADHLVDPQLVRAAGIVLVLQSLVWLIATSTSGLFFRVLAPFGYFPRMAWWMLADSVLSSVAPVTAVVLGADLLTAGIVAASASLLLGVPRYLDLWRLLRREGITFQRPDLRLGGRNFLNSLAISGKNLLESARQQGARLVLAPLAGATGLTAFSTMRTGTNVALQGLNTVVNPLMPELMRFLHQRDQPRSEAAFGIIWFVLIAVLAPAMVVFQAFVEPLYALWTRNKVPFDAALFATLSLSVLVYASAQPAIAVVKGNNLLRAQVLLSALAAVLVVGGIAIMVPAQGLRGAGVALLIGEVGALIGYQQVARKWLLNNGLKWPGHHFRAAIISIILAAGGMALLVIWPATKWVVLLGSLGTLSANLWYYWQLLPNLATRQAYQMIGRLPGLRHLQHTQ